MKAEVSKGEQIVDNPEGQISLGVIKDKLHMLADTARFLAGKLGCKDKPLSRREKEALKAVKIITIQVEMDEALQFAVTDNLDDFELCIQNVKKWMKFEV